MSRATTPRDLSLCNERFRTWLNDDAFADSYGLYLERLLRYCGRRRKRLSLRHYARHLADLQRNDELYALVDRAWQDAHRAAFGHLRYFVEEVDGAPRAG